MLHQPSGRNGPSPQRRKYTKKYYQIEPSSSQASPTLWGNHCGSDNRDCHTHSLAEPLCPSMSQHHWYLAVYQAPTSRLCGHARRRSTSTPRGQAQTTHTHTHSQGHRAVALLRPTCPQSNAIERNQAGMQPQQRKHMGASPPYGEDTPDRRQVQRKKKKGTSAKGSVLRLTCVPLPHFVLPLSGCACLGTPTMATRGEARGHPW